MLRMCLPREVPDSWASIPYGKALRNQVYQVVDDYGRICPNYVTGELWIGGAGLRGLFGECESNLKISSNYNR